MKYFSSFSGAEGIGLGFPSEWECVGFSEIHKGSSAVLNYHWPNIRNYGDITKIEWASVPDFDLLIGGSPCQDLSVAGKRAGLEGSRSSLFFEYVRALREKRPAYFLWENVAGAFSSNEGWDFAEVQTHLAESGYALWWQLLNAADFGVPQTRTRVLIVGARDGRIPDVLFESQDGGWNNQEGGESQEVSHSLTTKSGRLDPTSQSYIAHSLTTKPSLPSSTQRRKHENLIATTLDTRGGGHHIEQTLIAQNQRREVREKDIPGSLTAQQSSTQFQAVVDSIGIRRLTPLESERVMSWPDNHTKYGRNQDGTIFELSDAQRYFACGNGVATEMIRKITPYLLPTL